MEKRALEGVKVLELAQFVAGPYCSKLLADLGAEVVKIEKPGIGDEARRRGPFPGDIPHSERSGLFLYLNTNKMGITLDPKVETGRKLFKKLVQGADILIEDNPPRVMEEEGLNYECLKKINPKLIMTSITPFGQTGAYRDYKAYYLNTYHAGGLGYITPLRIAHPSRPPLKAGGYFGECSAGLAGAIATLAALYAQRKMGIGQRIDVSKQEVLLGLCMVYMGFYPNEGVVVDRFGRGLGMQTAMGGQQCCKDGYLALMAVEPHQWDSLLKLIGMPDWKKEERKKDIAFALKHAEEIQPVVSEWLMEHTKDEIYHQGQALGLPVTPVATAEDVVNSKQLAARGFFKEVEHPEMGKVKIPSAPYQFSRTPWAVERPTPLLGQHNEEIYCHRLGLNHEDLVKLKEAGVI
jgi:crotonobetainyl-CoA:carnitine CoA-transferase CaiB-like acyl-CoA transferase